MRKQNSGRRNPVNGRGGITHPPQFTPSFMVHKKLRFQAVAASPVGGSAIFSKGFGDLWCVAATATSAYQIAHYVRLRKVEMWGPMGSTLAPVTVAIDWTGSTQFGGFGKSNRISDTSIGASQCAHLVSRPPANSQISMWLDMALASSSQVCVLSYPAGTIIDVTYDLVVRDDASSVAVTGAVVGAVVGANYVRSLDNITAANLPPVSLSTI